MKQFGGYTLTELLNEPFTIFIRLFELACRVQADEALENIAAGAGAAINGGGKYLEARRGSMYVLEPATAGTEIIFSDEQLARAQALAKEISEGKGTVIEKITLGDLKQNV